MKIGGCDVSNPGRDDQDAAEGLWSRFRDIALALNRIQSYNFSADSPEGRFTERWLDEVLKDEDTLAEVGREFVLRAFRVGADAINFKILAHLSDEAGVPLAGLAEITGLPHFALSERVSDLVQAGLATRVLEEDAVRATRLTRGFLGMVEKIERRLSVMVRERLPALIGR